MLVRFINDSSIFARSAHNPIKSNPAANNQNTKNQAIKAQQITRMNNQITGTPTSSSANSSQEIKKNTNGMGSFNVPGICSSFIGIGYKTAANVPLSTGGGFSVLHSQKIFGHRLQAGSVGIEWRLDEPLFYSTNGVYILLANPNRFQCFDVLISNSKITLVLRGLIITPDNIHFFFDNTNKIMAEGEDIVTHDNAITVKMLGNKFVLSPLNQCINYKYGLMQAAMSIMNTRKQGIFIEGVTYNIKSNNMKMFIPIKFNINKQQSTNFMFSVTDNEFNQEHGTCYYDEMLEDINKLDHKIIDRHTLVNDNKIRIFYTQDNMIHIFRKDEHRLIATVATNTMNFGDYYKFIRDKILGDKMPTTQISQEQKVNLAGVEKIKGIYKEVDRDEDPSIEAIQERDRRLKETDMQEELYATADQKVVEKIIYVPVEKIVEKIKIVEKHTSSPQPVKIINKDRIVRVDLYDIPKNKELFNITSKKQSSPKIQQPKNKK